MPLRILVLLTVVLSLPLHPLFSASTSWQGNPQGQARLLSADDVVPPKGTILLGFHFKPIPNWYLYWKIAGDAGFPPKVSWAGTTGISHPELLWPAPVRIILPGPIVEYGYDGEVVYPIRAQLTGQQVHIEAQLSYLTCYTSCIPYKYHFAMDLPAGPSAVINSSDDTLIRQFLARVPEGQSDDQIMHSAPTHEKYPGEETTRPNVSTDSLGWILFLAFLGGVILNVMPCVLPVLSIKLLGLLQHSGEARAVVTRNSLASAAGIIGSFMALALAAISARKTGYAIGWGIQFQEPVFVGFLALVVFLFALNLWGMFEIGLPSLLGQFAVSFGRGESLSAYFVSGLFATLLATPCSAPFLGTAMGFALTQPSSTIVAIFASVGTGMALPYLLLAGFPRSVRWLPKPGPWMIHLRTLLGFLLAATVVWLGYVLSSQIQPVGMTYFYLSLVGISFAVWLRELLITHPRLGSPWVRRLTTLFLLLLVIGALSVIDHHRMSGPARLAFCVSSATVHWIPFDEPQAEELAREGKTVFVDVTADWCVTCKYNESFVLNNPEVAQAFQNLGAVMMKADWTNRDPAVTAYLEKHGRAGIPFYALYRPGRSVTLLSEFLTKAKVLHALQS